MTQVNDELDRLYGLPLDEFTASRDRLAGELREKGDRATAAEVKGFRRPTLPAWAVNQLARNHRSEIEELLAVGEEVRAAQRAALSGGPAQEMREIGARRRRVVEALIGRAETLLSRVGHATGRATLDKVGDTLMAATVDEEAAEAVQAGRLERELTPSSGFEAAAANPQVAEIAPKQEQRARERARLAEDQARQAEDTAKDAEREARRLEQEAERTRQDAERARRRADAAAERARELRRKMRQSSRPSGR